MREYVAPYGQGFRELSLVPGERRRLITFPAHGDTYLVPAGFQFHIEEQQLTNLYNWRFETNHPALLPLHGQSPNHSAGMVEYALMGEGYEGREYYLDMHAVSMSLGVMDVGWYLYGYHGRAGGRGAEPMAFFAPPRQSSMWTRQSAATAIGASVWTDIMTIRITPGVQYVRLYDVVLGGTPFVMNGRFRCPELGLSTWTMATSVSGDRLIGPVHVPVVAKLYPDTDYTFQLFMPFPITAHMILCGWTVP